MGFVLYLLDELEECLERAEFLESCKQLLHIPLTVNEASALVAVNYLLVLVGLILGTEDAPRMLLKFGISLPQIIVALHHHQTVIRVTMHPRHHALAREIQCRSALISDLASRCESQISRVYLAHVSNRLDVKSQLICGMSAKLLLQKPAISYLPSLQDLPDVPVDEFQAEPPMMIVHIRLLDHF